MDTIRKEIFDYIEDNDIKERVFATKIGCSPQLLSNAKSGKNFSFRALLKASIIIHGDNYLHKISEWALRMDTSEGIKQAFEFASLTKDGKLLEKLLKKHNNSSGLVKECCIVYQLIYDFMNKKFKDHELVEKVANVQGVTNKSLLILLDICKAYGLYYCNKYLLMLELVEEIESEILTLSDKRELFIKECFLLRCSEIYAPAYLQLNAPEMLRIHATRLISSKFCAKIVADGYYYMGMSYMAEDEKKCLENLQANYDIHKGRHQRYEERALTNLNFARSFFNKSLLKNETDESIIVYNKIKQGYHISTEEEASIRKNNSEPFADYYLALNERSTQRLNKSVNSFALKKQLFFANLVIQEIKKLNPNVLVVDGLLKFGNDEKGAEENEKNNYKCFSDFRDFKLYCG